MLICSASLAREFPKAGGRPPPSHDLAEPSCRVCFEPGPVPCLATATTRTPAEFSWQRKHRFLPWSKVDPFTEPAKPFTPHRKLAQAVTRYADTDHSGDGSELEPGSQYCLMPITSNYWYR